jgi:hypothetical protein
MARVWRAGAQGRTMRPMRRSFAALVLSMLALLGPAAADDGGGPAVVELFTSQGCSSCPPADRLLEELAARPDILALAFHVDYWDYIGWVDPYGSPEATARQRAYGRALGLRSIFTPQMVVDGRISAVGSRRGEVEDALAAAAARRARVPVSLARAGDRLVVEVAGAAAPAVPCDILVVRYETGPLTEVPRGENAGRTLVNPNVVRSARVVGAWDGNPARILIDADEGEAVGGYVALLQDPAAGPIRGAAHLEIE